MSPKIKHLVEAHLQETNGSVQELARKAGVGRSTLYRFLNDGPVSLQFLEKLMKAVGYTLDAVPWKLPQNGLGSSTNSCTDKSEPLAEPNLSITS